MILKAELCTVWSDGDEVRRIGHTYNVWEHLTSSVDECDHNCTYLHENIENIYLEAVKFMLLQFNDNLWTSWDE